MPKYGIHGIVLDRALADLRTRGTGPAASAAGVLSAHPGAAAMGAVGPDVFFWAPDYRIAAELRQILDAVAKATELYNAVMAPIQRIEDEVRDGALQLVDRLPPGVADVVKTLVAQIPAIANTYRNALVMVLLTQTIGIADFIRKAGDLRAGTSDFFAAFAPPLQGHLVRGGEHGVDDWYWFDMLHYRRTGLFASRLVEQARSRPPGQREAASAYAYGYLSHVAADVVGHAFVNRIVGAPYRMNVQRHVAAENFMDAWAYNALLGGASASRDILTHLPLPAAMPDEIVQLLDGALRATYDGLCPTQGGTRGFLAPDEIRDSYKTFREVLETLGKTGAGRPEEPFPGANDRLSEITSGLAGSLYPPPPPPEGAPPCSWEEILSLGATDRSRACYTGFFDRTEDWVKYFQEHMLWMFETAEDLTALIRETASSMTVRDLFALLYGVHLLLYATFRSARNVLAVFGFVTPEADELGNNVAFSLATTFLACGSEPGGYPRARDNSVSHLVCPTSPPEIPATRPDVLPPIPALDPVALIEDRTFSREILRRYATAGDPAQARQLAASGLRIGGATALTRWMIETAADANASPEDRRLLYANWNLDSDRGYGYRTWYGTGTAGGAQIAGEEYRD